MKSLLKLTSIIFIGIFCFISCDNEPLSDDIELNTPSTSGGVDITTENIIGTWEVADQKIEILQTISISFQDESTSEEQIINMNQQSGDITLTFTDDGQYTSSGSATLIVSGEQSGQSFPESTETGINNFTSGTWSVADSVLTLVSAESEGNYIIVSFTGTTMDVFTNEELQSFSTILESGDIPDITDLTEGFEDFPDFNFDVEQDFEAEFNLTKVD